MRWLVVALVLSGSLVGCQSASDVRAQAVAAGVFSPRRLTVGNTPLVTLGQLLFFDRELSGNRNVACATCHLPPDHSTDARHLGVGQDHARLSRASIDLFNRGSVESMFWDGRLERVDGVIHAPVTLPDGIATLAEAQALLPLLDRHEMRGQAGDVASDGRANELAALPDDATTAVWSALVARLLAIDGYRPLFAAAYPDVPATEISIVHVARAIAAFESRLWDLTDTPFDDYLGGVGTPGNDGALDESAMRGGRLFFGDAGCARCHDGPLLGDGSYHAIGVPQIGPGRDAAHRDEGRFAVTHDPADRFAFRTPPLRNVAMTAPYMHDGAFDTLDEAVRHHLDPASSLARYQGPGLPDDLRSQVQASATAEIAAAIDPDTRPLRPLAEGEIQDLVWFLTAALTSRTEQSLPPNAGMPPSVPSGLPIDMPAPLDDVLP